MRLGVVAVLVTSLGGLATAQTGGLDGALERQRQNLATQQGEIRRETEQQGRTLQQRQDQNLQFQLLQRQQPVAPPRLPSCTQAGAILHCQ